MAVSFAGFSSKALCWRSVVAEKVSHAAKPTKSAIHTEASPVAAAAIFIPNASPMAVTLFAIRSWIMFLIWAALDRSGGLFVNLFDCVQRKPSCWYAIAQIMPAAHAKTTPSQLIFIV